VAHVSSSANRRAGHQNCYHTINLPRHHAIPDLADSVLGVLFMVRRDTPVHADDRSASGGGARQRR